MKKTLPGLLAATAFVALMATGPVMAQGTDGMSGQTGQNESRTTSDQQENNNTNWGWLGLAGLAGLAGMRRPAPTVVHQDREGAARSYSSPS